MSLLPICAAATVGYYVPGCLLRVLTAAAAQAEVAAE